MSADDWVYSEEPVRDDDVIAHGGRWRRERDRYRRALEQIAERGGPPYPDWQLAGRAEDREEAMQAVARRALDG